MLIQSVVFLNQKKMVLIERLNRFNFNSVIAADSEV